MTLVLFGNLEWHEAKLEYRPQHDIILAGTIPPNPSELASSSAMETLLQELEESYDVVIVDTPPLLPVTDAAVLSKRVAGAIVVANCGRRGVLRGDLVQAVEMLET